METSMRGRLATARLSLNTFVLKASAVYAHPCALVEPDRARRVLSVHAETHALEATTGVLLEDMLEESDRKAATPKRRANSEDVDPPDPGLGLQWACQRNPGQVPLFRLGQEPELGVEGGMAQEPLCPILERVARERPRIGEGVHLRLIDAALFALLERAHREAVRPPRRGQLTVRALGEEYVAFRVDIGQLPVVAELRGRLGVRPVQPPRMFVQEHGGGFGLVWSRRPDGHLAAHAETSSSRTSGSGERSGISRSGSGLGSSPRRLTQTEVKPSSRAGAMSWKRLAAT